jgi:hypothetical protein
LVNKTIPRTTRITTPNRIVPMPMATPKVKKPPPDEPLAEEEDEAELFISGWVGGGENSIAGGADLSGGMKGLSF